MGLKTVLADAFRNRYGKLLREALFHYNIGLSPPYPRIAKGRIR